MNWEKTSIPPRVQTVARGSIAKRTGLMPGDIVTHVNGVPVSTHLEATTLIQQAETVGLCPNARSSNDVI